MAWGCKQKPDGCGWASWEQWPGSGQRDWWCDTCERSGTVMVQIEGDRTLWCGASSQVSEGVGERMAPALQLTGLLGAPPRPSDRANGAPRG